MGNSKSKMRKERRLSDDEARTQEETHSNQDLYLPQKKNEVERLQSMHFLFIHIFECRFLPPIENKLKDGAFVLDIGCGPGTWILDMASHYPCSEFYGFDIHVVFPSQIRPPNTHFKQANALDGLAFDNDSFDLVRMSSMLISFDEQQYLGVLRDSFRILKPGGYIELIESEIPLVNEGPIFQKLLDSFESLLSSKGIDIRLAQKLESLVSSIDGFTSIQTDRRITMLNEPEGGISGKLLMQTIDEFFQSSVASGFAAGLGLSLEEYMKHWQVCKDEIVTHGTGLALRKVCAQKRF
ncbi:11851_t:CDS:2 [Ambispora gerdemannii]|uniref:11851_t:CDS:1 n=1 Tax=Ambispora gerdemannii TaxID=144530 RepID=A0A9N9F823_9GLOM|nr:11851_t:CDS:2 [Ambispora gerdemannii]